MEKKKIEVVNLNLGMDVNPNPGEISENSKEKIDSLVGTAKKEKETLQVNLLSESNVKKCYEMLMQATNAKQPISGESLLKATGNKAQLATLIIKLRQYARERGDIWEISKHRIGNITHYSMRPKL